MKTALMMIGMVMVSGSAFAQSLTTQGTVKYYNMQACSSWSYINAGAGNFGYVCSSYPGLVSVPEVHTTVDAINEVEKTLLDKIAQLEARIAELEKKP